MGGAAQWRKEKKMKKAGYCAVRMKRRWPLWRPWEHLHRRKRDPERPRGGDPRAVPLFPFVPCFYLLPSSLLLVFGSFFFSLFWVLFTANKTALASSKYGFTNRLSLDCTRFLDSVFSVTEHSLLFSTLSTKFWNYFSPIFRPTSPHFSPPPTVWPLAIYSHTGFAQS